MNYTSLLVDSYYTWLLELIDGGAYNTNDYSLLIEKLFNTEFVDPSGLDENRIYDGLELRSEFTESIGEHLYYLIDNLDEKCSVLEMLIGLARRWDRDVMYDPYIGDRSCDWFWIMMSNLGLDFFTDECFDEEEIDKILDIFMYRKYGEDGVGSLFPNMKNRGHFLAKKWSKSGQKVVKNDIWSQINEYFIENPWLETL